MARTLAWTMCGAIVMLTGRADAETPDHRADARAAYDGASLAFQRGDFAVAAREFARADALEPNDVALGQALDSALRSESAALALNLAERTRERAVGADIEAKAAEARTTFTDRATEIVVHCDDCDDRIDGEAIAGPTWVDPGTHEVTMRRGSRVDRIVVDAVGGNVVDVRPPPIPRSAPKAPIVLRQVVPERSPRVVSPWVFAVAAGVTAVAGGLTIASAVDTASTHRDFMADPNAQMSNDGRASETRTNVLLGITSAAAVSTAVLGVVFVRWTSPKHASTVGLRVSPSSVGFGGTFR